MHHTHDIDALAAAFMDLLGILNSPRQDDVLLEAAGVSLPRALFPLLVRIGASGAIGVGLLAEQVGRDHSTISRQVAALEKLGLVKRRANAEDSRINEAAITARGNETVARITKARRKLLGALLSDWSEKERHDLARLNRKLADAMKARQA
ncbi:MAG: MarR family winged helix-turn-helix transcriptional regulator [Rhizomicrobium sp.]